MSLVRDFSPGKLTNTGNPLNVAIAGPGFFQVMTNTGDTAYTRNGSFQMDETGNLVTHHGHPVQPGIQIGPDAAGVEISGDGAVHAIRSDGIEKVGRLQIFTFPNEQGLRALNDAVFVLTTASGLALAAPPLHGIVTSLHQGFLESSNALVSVEDMRLFQFKQWYSAIMVEVSGLSEPQLIQAAAEKP